jgi:hypothetical protein
MFLSMTRVGRVMSVVAAVTAVSAVWATPGEARTNQPANGDGCQTTGAFVGARTCTYTFTYTQSIETFVVPPTINLVEITAVGAPGAGDRGYRSRGARVTATFANLAGMPVFIAVGGEGWVDGFNGGQPGGGGGASDVRLGVPDLKHRIIVAGGGGGWGERLVDDPDVGQRVEMVKGGDAGEPGRGSGGQPGTATAGGAGGGTEFGPGRPGRLGHGGAGGDGLYGGGGGGLYGGGGGGGCAGIVGNSHCVFSQPGSGGGGSSLVPPGGTFALSHDVQATVVITLIQYAPWPKP